MGLSEEKLEELNDRARKYSFKPCNDVHEDVNIGLRGGEKPALYVDFLNQENTNWSYSSDGPHVLRITLFGIDWGVPLGYDWTLGKHDDSTYHTLQEVPSRSGISADATRMVEIFDFLEVPGVEMFDPDSHSEDRRVGDAIAIDEEWDVLARVDYERNPTDVTVEVKVNAIGEDDPFFRGWFRHSTENPKARDIEVLGVHTDTSRLDISLSEETGGLTFTAS